jgi:hypothetical protein
MLAEGRRERRNDPYRDAYPRVAIGPSPFSSQMRYSSPRPQEVHVLVEWRQLS